VGEGKNVGRDCRRVNMVSIFCNVNGKMRTVETILGMEGW
jgi:hypothetical protein